VCGIVLRLTGEDRLARVLGVLLDKPLRILILIFVAILVRRLLHRLIDRMAQRVAAGRPSGPLQERNGGATAWMSSSPLLSSRREQRARTVASILRSATTTVIGVVVALMILGELKYDLGPLLASAGVIGVALGLGGQAIVRDFLAGIFMILEDQYGVGDVIDVKEATGTVEAVGLRVTRLRDVGGTVWYVRNGEILRVGNQSQGWSRAVLDIGIAYSEDIARARELLLDAATGLREDTTFSCRVLYQPDVWGVEVLSTGAVVLRLVVKTQPLQQWTVARELRRRINERFDAAGMVTHGQHVPG